MSAPHEWDAGFVGRLLGDLPAVLLAFVGAEKPDDRYTELLLDGHWAAYVATGWNGADQAARRLGVGAGYDLMHRVGAGLHNAMLEDENGERLTRVTVGGMGVESDSSVDLANLWIGSVAIEVELPLELDAGSPCYGPLTIGSGSARRSICRAASRCRTFPTLARPATSRHRSTCRNERARTQPQT